MEENTVTFNGRLLTESQLQSEKERVERERGVDIIEVKKDEYKTRLQD